MAYKLFFLALVSIALKGVECQRLQQAKYASDNASLTFGHTGKLGAREIFGRQTCSGCDSGYECCGYDYCMPSGVRSSVPRTSTF